METVNISDLPNPAANVPVGLSISGIINQLGLFNIAFFLIGAVFMFSLVAAAVGYINAGGSPDAINKAHGRLINSLIGLAVVMGAFIIVRLVATTIGLQSTLIF